MAYANNKGNRNRNGDSDPGTGNFTGSKTAEFRIGQLITNETKFTISCPALTDGTQYVYDGSAFEPEVTVTRIEGNKKLVKDSNYSVTYTDNIHAGPATVSCGKIWEDTSVYGRRLLRWHREILRTAA